MSRGHTQGLSRRSFLATLAVGSAAAALAACTPTAPPASEQKPAEQTSSEQKPSAPAQQQPASAGEVTLEFWSPWSPSTPDGEILQQKMIPTFEEKFPGLKVKYEYVATTGNTQAAEKLLTAINGGTPPDLNYFDRFIVTSWAAQGFLTELTAYAQTDKLTEDMFLKEAWLEATWQGKLYATPFTTDFRMLYYNKKHFEEVGLDPDKPPTTIAELDAAADKLTKKDGSKFTRMGLIPWAYQGQLYTWGWLWGGEFYDAAKNEVTANHPKVVEALEWMVSYAKKFGIDGVDSFASAFKNQQGGFAGNEQHGLVLGLISMASDGDWQISNHQIYMKPEDFEAFDVVPLPQAPGGPQTSSWGGGWSIVLPKGLKNPDEAWKFAHWWATDNQKTYAMERQRVPTLIELFDEKNFADKDPRWQKFLKLKDLVRFRPNIPVGQQLWTELLTATDQAIHDKGQPKELLDGVNERVNNELAKFK